MKLLTLSDLKHFWANAVQKIPIKISDLQDDVALGTHIADTDIHVTSSDKTTWNTVTSKAQDSDVVHKSGDETVGGVKTFLDVPIPFKSSTAELGVTGGSTKVIFTDKNLLNLAGITFGNYGSSKLSYCRFHIYDKDSNNQEIENFIEFSYVNNNQVAYFRPNRSNFVTLGTINNRWNKVYADEYYYGPNNVEFSTKFVTTDTAQTVSGSKTFSSNVNVYNSDNTADTPNIILKNSKAERGSTTNLGEQNIFFLDKDNAQIGNIKCITNSSGVSNMYITCNVSGSDKGVRLSRTPSTTYFRSDTDNDCKLGTADVRWSDVQTYKVNALEPSSLSLPSQTYVDISSYFTNTGTGEHNTYTAPSNGWIFLRLGNISGCQADIFDTNNNRMWGQSTTGGVEQITIPILSGCTLRTQWNTNSTVNVDTARFYPCQGNV